MKFRNIPPFVLTSGDSLNDQHNDNGKIEKLKSLYIVDKATWMLNYGKTKFLHHHMNSVLIGSWDTFKVSYGNIIREIFEKTNLPPLSPD